MAVNTETISKLVESDWIRNELGIYVRWRVQTAKGQNARIVAYQDARDVQRALDFVVGPSNWQNEPRQMNGNLYMAIGINVENEGWIWKADVGAPTDIEKEKGEASDALKRAAVMWGLFRDIYLLDPIILKSDGKYPLTDEGVALKTAEAITLYCNSITKTMNYLRLIFLQMQEYVQKDEELKEVITTLKNKIIQYKK